MYPQFLNEKAWLVQSVLSEDRYCKLLYIGVRESVKAVTARAIRGDTLEWGTMRFQPWRNMKLCISHKVLGGSPYVMGGVYYPSIMEDVVCGDSADELSYAAASVFRKYIGVPLLDEWMPLCWDIAVQSGYAVPLDAWGVAHDVWRLTLSAPDAFLSLLEEHLPEMLRIAQQTVSVAA